MLRFFGENEKGDKSRSSKKEGNETQIVKCLELYKQALHLQQKGSKREARDIYEEILKSDAFKADIEPASNVLNVQASPHHALRFAVFKNYAAVLDPSTESNLAIDFLLKALKIDPYDVGGWLELGNRAWDKDDLVLAADSFSTAYLTTRMKRQSLQALTRLEQVEIRLGDIERAIRTAKLAMELNPTQGEKRGVPSIDSFAFGDGNIELQDAARGPLEIQLDLETPTFADFGRTLLEYLQAGTAEEGEGGSAARDIAFTFTFAAGTIRGQQDLELADQASEDGAAGPSGKRKTPTDDNDEQKEGEEGDEDATNTRRSGRKQRRVAPRQDTLTEAVVAGAAAKANDPTFVIDESILAELHAHVDAMVPAGYTITDPEGSGAPASTESVNEYCAAVIDRFLDIALGGLRSRHKKFQKPQMEQSKGSMVNTLVAAEVQEPSDSELRLSPDSLADFILQNNGKSLPEWCFSFVHYCLKVGSVVGMPQALSSVVIEMLEQLPENDPTWDILLEQRYELALTGLEILLDSITDHIAEHSGPLEEAPGFGLFALLMSRLRAHDSLLSRSGSLRLRWASGRFSTLEALIENAERDYNDCLGLLKSEDDKVEIVGARWDPVICRASVESKLRSILFRRYLEQVEAARTAEDPKGFLELVAPLVVKDKSVLAKFGVSSSQTLFDSKDLELFCQVSERTTLLWHFSESIRNVEDVDDLCCALDSRVFGDLLLSLSTEGSTTRTLLKLEQLDQACQQLTEQVDKGTIRIDGPSSNQNLVGNVLLANRLVSTMLLRWPDFIRGVNPHGDKEQLRRFSQQFVVRVWRLFYSILNQIRQEAQDAESDMLSDWLVYCHQLLGAREICDADNHAFLHMCLRRFTGAGPEFSDAFAHCFNCLYDIPLDPDAEYEEHATKPISLGSDGSEFITAIASRWREAMFQAKSLERRQQLVKMLSKVIETIGEEWTQSAHVENNRRQLEQFLDTPIKESDCFGKVVLPPLRQLQGDPDCQVPLAAFQLHFLRGSLMLPLYDPTRSEFLEWAKMIEEALPSLLLNLALNHETFEAWWTVGFAYTHLAWCILSQENGNVLRNYKDEIAQYQKRAFHALSRASQLFLAQNPDPALTLRPSPFSFLPKTRTLSSDVYSHIAFLIVSIFSKPMDSFALQASSTTVQKRHGWEEKFAQVQPQPSPTNPTEPQPSRPAPVVEKVPKELQKALRLLALRCTRAAATENSKEWQYPLLEGKLLSKLDRPHTEVLSAYERALHLQPVRSKPPTLDCRLAILCYLAKHLIDGSMSVEEATPTLRSLKVTEDLADVQAALQQVYLQLEYLRRADEEKGKPAYRSGFLAIYRMAKIQLDGFQNLAEARKVLSMLFLNYRLRPSWKSGASWPGSLLRASQAISALRATLVQDASDFDEALAILTGINKDLETSSAEIYDADSVWKSLFTMCFENLRTRDPLGEELVPVAPGMSTAFGKRMTRSHFEKVAPNVENKLWAIISSPTPDELFSRRLTLLAELNDLMSFRDNWHTKVRHLVVDTEEDSDLDRMAVAIYTWMWRMVNANGEFDPAEDKHGDEEKGDPKLRFKWIARRIPVFLKVVSGFITRDKPVDVGVKRQRRKKADAVAVKDETEAEAGQQGRDGTGEADAPGGGDGAESGGEEEQQQQPEPMETEA